MGTGKPPGRPRKKPAQTWVDEQFDLSGDAQIAADIEYQEFLATLGDGNVAVTIHRFPKFGNVMEWCDNTTLDQATLEAIRENHGPGKYKLSFRGPQHMLGTKNICIAAPFSKDGRPAAGKSDAETFLQSQLAMQQNLLMSLMGSMKGPDLGGMMAGLAAMMTALKPPVGENAKPVDPVQMFQTIMQIYQGLNKSDKSPLEQLRDTAAVLKEFSGDGGGGEMSMWGAIASVGKDAVEKLAPAIASLGGKNPAVATTQPVMTAARLPAMLPASAEAGTDGAARPDPSQVSAEDNLRRWLTAQIAYFKEKAKAGKDPGFWIDYVFENSEEPGCQAILYAIRQGATFENLLAFDPEIGQNPQLTLWFTELYNGVKSGLSNDDLDSGREGGNGSDRSENGGIGAPGHTLSVSPSTSESVS
jgi:hypothetical protein